jgi:hypothetical protein
MAGEARSLDIAVPGARVVAEELRRAGDRGLLEYDVAALGMAESQPRNAS